MADVKKKVENLDKIQKKLDDQKERLKCQCFHTKQGDLDVTKDNKAPQGQLRYICRRCRKPLSFNKIRQAEDKYIIQQGDVGKPVTLAMLTLQQGVEIVDKAIDIVKITLDPTREEDKVWGNRIAKLQYRIRTNIIPLYTAALKRNNGGRKKGRGNQQRQNTNGGSRWSANRR